MEKNDKILVKQIMQPSGLKYFKPNLYNQLFKKPLNQEKNTLPPIILNTVKCTFCQNSVQKILFKTHYENHPSKILDFLYLGSYSNASNIKVIK